MTEVLYRDSAGQMCLVHDVIRDLCSRAGQDFLLLGRGTMLPFDHVVTIDGQRLSDGAG
jgi:Rho-binding antiterminator